MAAITPLSTFQPLLFHHSPCLPKMTRRLNSETHFDGQTTAHWNHLGHEALGESYARCRAPDSGEYLDAA